ncbi:hypothetical protein [Bartonella raoultii]
MSIWRNQSAFAVGVSLREKLN